MDWTFASEVEIKLVNRLGYQVNRAKEILDDPEVKENDWATKEGRKSQIEIRSHGGQRSLRDFSRDLLGQWENVARICSAKEMLMVPASEFGAGKAERNNDIERLLVYDAVLGLEEVEKLLMTSGTHNHWSKHTDPRKRVIQHRLMTAFDPFAAFASTSPINAHGKNDLNCHRIWLLRHGIDANPALLDAEIPEYIESLEELKQRDVERYELWKEMSLANGVSEADFERLFQIDNTGYAQNRDRPKFGTYEGRVADASPVDVVTGNQANFKGIFQFTFGRDVSVEVARQDDDFLWSTQRIVLPTKKTLRKMEVHYVNSGLKDDLLREYLTQGMQYSAQGLERKERAAQEPLFEMLEDQKNYADRIMEHIKSLGHQGHFVSENMAAAANLYLHSASQKAIERVKSSPYFA